MHLATRWEQFRDNLRMPDDPKIIRLGGIESLPSLEPCLARYGGRLGKNRRSRCANCRHRDPAPFAEIRLPGLPVLHCLSAWLPSGRVRRKSSVNGNSGLCSVGGTTIVPAVWPVSWNRARRRLSASCALTGNCLFALPPG